MTSRQARSSRTKPRGGAVWESCRDDAGRQCWYFHGPCFSAGRIRSSNNGLQRRRRRHRGAARPITSGAPRRWPHGQKGGRGGLLRLRIPGGEDGAEKRPKTKVAGRRHSASATLPLRGGGTGQCNRLSGRVEGPRRTSTLINERVLSRCPPVGQGTLGRLRQQSGRWQRRTDALGPSCRSTVRPMAADT
ncbi:hypothetical protein MRX96_019621 [Rhipicephalus microplus]